MADPQMALCTECSQRLVAMWAIIWVSGLVDPKLSSLRVQTRLGVERDMSMRLQRRMCASFVRISKRDAGRSARTGPQVPRHEIRCFDHSFSRCSWRATWDHPGITGNKKSGYLRNSWSSCRNLLRPARML